MTDKEKHTRIEYISENGYKGVLYGKSSFAIYDSAGRMMLHTGFRNINTYDELMKQVDTYPEFRKLLLDNMKDDEVIKEKTGHWITAKDEYGDIYEAVCSCCDKNGVHKYNYCPWCGARMEVENE